MRPRHFFQENTTPEQILIDQAEMLRGHAQRMPAGMKRDRLLERAADIERRVNIQAWVDCPGLRPPER